jgi:hypothetical protein
MYHTPLPFHVQFAIFVALACCGSFNCFYDRLQRREHPRELFDRTKWRWRRSTPSRRAARSPPAPALRAAAVAPPLASLARGRCRWRGRLWGAARMGHVGRSQGEAPPRSSALVRRFLPAFAAAPSVPLIVLHFEAASVNDYASTTLMILRIVQVYADAVVLLTETYCSAGELDHLNVAIVTPQKKRTSKECSALPGVFAHRVAYRVLSPRCIPGGQI